MPIVYRRGLQKADLDYIQSELNRSLPADYRDFLIEMNGCYLSAPDYAQIPLTAVDECAVSFDRFFGLLPLDECNDLIQFNNEFVGEVGFLKNALVIGEDGGGNPYVMVEESEGVRRGIYYWDRTHLHDSDSKNDFDVAEVADCGNLFFIASDFSEFYRLILQCVGASPEFLEEV
ncbi:SMI1/KNR4 family protein [Pseudomonas syringae group sp. J309-1]|uniref:SMI1/KNR4 family protein n=1 Tax=Pseudomonas syringae group sp. J309-1 TaxID=3079588 RepID=UPI002914E408|nr:SMI1/KNR4 family protein [Pseudomonas syringae group sp. J309-1]MDU8359358.1 SMI1/KNR4 family protein [Pseudomonas syringae group sp. J309-1]